jgi:transposase
LEEARVIGVPRGVSVYAHAEPCDMRKSFNTLTAIVEQVLRRDVLEGDLFLFVSRDRKRSKVLYFDGTGMCLFSKRMEKGQFAAPWKRAKKPTLELTLSELALFIEGSEALGRVELSPPLLRKADLRPKFPERKMTGSGI